MRISEVAGRVGVEVSTVRYYERIGLVGLPPRTTSGYRDYDEDAVERLLFVARARRIGLSCEQITALLPIWDRTNCSAARERIIQLIDAKRVETAARIADLKRFAGQLDEMRVELETTLPPATCGADLTCCVPDTQIGAVDVDLIPTSRTRRQPPRPLGPARGRRSR